MRKRCILFFLIYAGGTSLILGQAVLQPVGGRYFAFGAYSSARADVMGSTYNAASLAMLRSNTAGVYGERRFLIDNLNYFHASGALKTNSGTFGFQAGYFGFSLQNQSKLSLAYGRRLGDKIDVGASVDYLHLSQSGGYGSASAFTASLGALLHVSEKMNVGVSAFNPFRAGYGSNEGERIPAVYRFGIAYDAGEKASLVAEAEKEEGQKVNVNLGFHYQVIQAIFMRAGIHSQTASYYMGFGFLTGGFRLDLATSYHPQLGWSPGVALIVGKPTAGLSSNAKGGTQ